MAEDHLVIDLIKVHPMSGVFSKSLVNNFYSGFVMFSFRLRKIDWLGVRFSRNGGSNFM